MAHWKELEGYSGREKKKAFVKFCTQWWPLYSLEKGVRWPPARSLDDETLLPLMLFLGQEQKWEEVRYADMFFLPLAAP